MSLNCVSLCVAFLIAALALKANCVHSGDTGSEYDYGDLSISYDTLHYDDPNSRNDAYPQRIVGGKTLASKDINSVVALPLCCPDGEVYDTTKCIFAPSSFDWTPKLDGAVEAPFTYAGFPKCNLKQNYVDTYQKEVHFNMENGKVFLPYYVQLSAIPKENYCISKVYDESDLPCEDFQTKIFSCFNEEKDPQALMWTAVSLSHILIFITLLTYFLISDLRCLQGQYMICFLISLLIYNLCLFPGSQLPMDVSDVACIALGAVKYFFFCGIFLWFNAICFDVWRTLRNKQDISGRRRFLLYSAYSWIVGAILTTVVLVLPYTKEGASQGSRDDSLMDKSYHGCKLKMEMNMILQIAQLLSLIIDLIFLIMASCFVCGYPKFGNGLPRCDASLCLKQGWKLFVIMLTHTICCIDKSIISIPVPVWFYLLLESVAVFGVFAYRRTIIKRISSYLCYSKCLRNSENGSMQEKDKDTINTVIF